jgi:uncharacterized membrane protein SirB2
MYPTLLLIHVSCVVISITGFTLRGVFALRGAAVMQQRWIRVLPHFNDTLLLGSAITMAVLSGQYPFYSDWLTAKLFGLLAYVGLGVFALRGKNPAIQRGSFAMALLVFAWMVSVALTRHPAGFFAVAA